MSNSASKVAELELQFDPHKKFNIHTPCILFGGNHTPDKLIVCPTNF